MSQTLSNIASQWIHESAPLFSEETLQIYRSFFELHFVPWFGDRSAISGKEVREFIAAKRAEGMSDSSLYNMQRVLARVLDYGAAIGECPAPDWAPETTSPKPRKGATILPIEDQKRLERYLTDNPYPKNLALFLMLTAGMSVGEVTELKWEDVSIRTSTIRVRDRQVHIDERQKIYLRKMESLPAVYLWTGKTTQLFPSGLRDRLQRITEELQLPRLRVSDLMRTYAVRCLEGGMSYSELAERLGMADPRDARRYYSALLPPEIRAAREKEIH